MQSGNNTGTHSAFAFIFFLMNIDESIFTVWPTGRLLGYSGLVGQTDYEHGLIARTQRKPIGIYVVWPGECFLEFSAETPGDNSVLFSSDFFLCGLDGSRARGVMLDAYHLLVEGEGVQCNNVNDLLSVSREGNRLLVGVAIEFRQELIQVDIDGILMDRQSWIKDLGFPSPDSNVERRTLFTALSIMKGQISSPDGAIHKRWSTPDRWPHRKMWLWDSVFHAVGWRHLDPDIARDMLEAVIGMQRDDGFIPLSASPQGAQSTFTQPPILAFGVGQVCGEDIDQTWLEAIYPRLCGYIEWDMRNRDSDGGGLCEWKIEANENCRSGESGMDNSPRFDKGISLDAVDFNAYLALECETLAGFARVLGRRAEADQWDARHAELCTRINDRLWSDEVSFYCDYDPEKDEHSSIFSSAGFLPLICGAVPPERLNALLLHLKDPGKFGTSFPIPSVSVCNDEVYSKDMWRGPTWININWLISMGLKRYGCLEESLLLEAKTKSEIERWCEEYGTLFEYYDDRGVLPPPELLRKGCCSPERSPFFQVFHDYGWTACLYLDMALQTPRKNSPSIKI